MRSLRLREAARDGGHTLSRAWVLLKAWPAASLELGLVLAVLPGLLKAFFLVRSLASLLGAWDGWLAAAMGPGQAADSLLMMINATIRQSGQLGLGANLVELARSLLLTPLLMTALALLYNNRLRPEERSAFGAAARAGQSVRRLMLAALICMVAAWVVQMVPSLASGVLSLLTDLLSWIPVLGSVVSVLATVLSTLLWILTDLAVSIVFCYVWICVACEEAAGFGALVRSWQLTRNALRETVASLALLVLVRLLATVVVAALWLLAGRPLGMGVTGLMYVVYGVNAAFGVLLAAITSALYQNRPIHDAPSPGQFVAESLDTMKRANLD